ncbi:Holliday junction resolvase-like protein [Thermoanaerobacterium thermosaccharolyticum]|uniref:Holliday junction resolvase-like protein n=1 Tax=Thermoanaerobacterium thermosaccharolyticum TaxID=1517 RepID=UPI003DA90FBB
MQVKVFWILIIIIIILAGIYLLYKLIDKEANRKFLMWKEEDKNNLEKTIRAEYETKLEKWKLDSEEKIRKNAVQTSRNTITGQVAEQLAPYLPEFPYNPKDIKFIGNPIDYVVFDGLSEGDVKQIILLEVKSGHSGLNKNERMIRNVLNEKNVKFEIYRIEDIKE